MRTILVTGGSGFIASHILVQLLSAGHRVRATVRDLTREPQVRAMLREGGVEPGERLSFVAADLQKDSGWAEAVAGCEYVLHVASPLPTGAPKDESELIVPAREGTLRVLRAARDAGVKRVVVTSSFAAVGYGHRPQTEPFTEEDWSDLNSQRVAAYPKSKTLAERAAWDFISREGNELELSVVNPVAVLGPVLGPDYSTSVLLVKRLLDGSVPAVPRLYFGIVDVRDLADLHVRAMTHPAAKGQRFLAVSGEFMSMLEMAQVLRNRMGAWSKRVPTRQLPDWLVRIIALGHPGARQITPELGKVKSASGEKARRLLGWAPRPHDETLVATAESLIRLGLVNGRRPHGQAAVAERRPDAR